MVILTLQKMFLFSRRLFLLMGPLGLIFALAACKPSGSDLSLSSSVVAIIGRNVITLKELENLYEDNGTHLLSTDKSDGAPPIQPVRPQ